MSQHLVSLHHWVRRSFQGTENQLRNPSYLGTSSFYWLPLLFAHTVVQPFAILYKVGKSVITGFSELQE